LDFGKTSKIAGRIRPDVGSAHCFSTATDRLAMAA
jgi:hypothetical protein